MSRCVGVSSDAVRPSLCLSVTCECEAVYQVAGDRVQLRRCVVSTCAYCQRRRSSVDVCTTDHIASTPVNQPIVFLPSDAMHPRY